MLVANPVLYYWILIAYSASIPTCSLRVMPFNKSDILSSVQQNMLPYYCYVLLQDGHQIVPIQTLVRSKSCIQIGALSIEQPINGLRQISMKLPYDVLRKSALKFTKGSKRENSISYYFLLFWFHQNSISSTKNPAIMLE